MAQYHCDQIINFRLDERRRKKGSFTSLNKSTSSSSSSSSCDWNINFNFCCSPYIGEFVRREHSREPRLMRRFDLPKIMKHLRINQITTMNMDMAREIIDQEFKSWGLWSDNCRLLSDFALDKAREVAKSMPCSHNTVYLNIHVLLVHKHIFDQRHDISLAMQHSMEEDRDFLVPASDSSIEALERSKIILILEDSHTCSICLEEYSEGCEGICMPCSHFFHGDCINKWLKTSHYCPLCRFEMPMSC